MHIYAIYYVYIVYIRYILSYIAKLPMLQPLMISMGAFQLLGFTARAARGGHLFLLLTVLFLTLKMPSFLIDKILCI